MVGTEIELHTCQYDHPEGLNPMMNKRGEPTVPNDQHSFCNQTIRKASDESFHEMTGKKGDVILMHPLMLHSASKNGLRSISECSPRYARTLLHLHKIAEVPSCHRDNHEPTSLAVSSLPVQQDKPIRV